VMELPVVASNTRTTLTSKSPDEVRRCLIERLPDNRPAVPKDRRLVVVLPETLVLSVPAARPDPHAVSVAVHSVRRRVAVDRVSGDVQRPCPGKVVDKEPIHPREAGGRVFPIHQNAGRAPSRNAFNV